MDFPRALPLGAAARSSFRYFLKNGLVRESEEKSKSEMYRNYVFVVFVIGKGAVERVEVE